MAVNSNQTISSAVWDYFNIDPTELRYAVCNICNKRVSRGSLNSNFSTTLPFNHLKVHHSAEYNLISKKKPQFETQIMKQQGLEESFAQNWPDSDPRAQRITDAISSFLILDCQPFKIVNNLGFEELLPILK